MVAKKTETIFFRVSPKERTKLEELAASEGERVSEFLRRLVRHEHAKRERKKAK